MMGVGAAAICIGVGFMWSFPSCTKKMKAEYLRRAYRINELKGLGDLLKRDPLGNKTVVVFGTVGSNSPLVNSRSGALCVFSEETARICLKREENCTTVSSKDCKNVMLNRKEVSWFLDDGIARVDVVGAQFAKGFYDTLNKYTFAEPVTEHVESLFSLKDIQIVANSCCEYVLEIGKPLTVVGKVERGKDGAPTIRRVSHIFSGHINVDELASDLKSDSQFYGMFSVLLTGIGVTILAVSVLHIPLEFLQVKRLR